MRFLMIKIILIVLYFVLPAGMSFAQVTRFEAIVNEYSTVPTFEPVTLGHLMNVDRFQGLENSDLAQKVFEIALMSALGQEKTLVMTSDELAKVIRDKFSFQDLQRLSIRLPEKITIRAKAGYVSLNKIAHQIRLSASKICRGCRIKITDLKIPELSSKEELLGIEMPFDQIKSGGSFLLPMNVIGSKGHSSLWVTGKLQFFKMLPVATKMIQQGQKIETADIEVGEREITTSKDSAPEVSELIGQTLNRFVSMGQPIFFSYIKKNPVAQRGELVKVIIGAESFEVSTQGSMEQDAFIGDLVKVRHPDTKKMMTGRLKEKGLVVIE